MKRILLSIVCFASVMMAFSQAPEGFNYQAVLRNDQGAVMANSEVKLLLTLKQNGPGGVPVFSEYHTAKTDRFGMVNLEIGSGTPASGALNTIRWSRSTYWLEVSMDDQGNDHYKSLGATKIMAVPYASQAGMADAVSPELYEELKGTQWYEGTQIPDPATPGQSGDYYMDISTAKIYRKQDNGTWVYRGTLSEEGGQGDNRADPNDWTTTGNAGTSPSTNFIGTTDGAGLAFRINNLDKMRLNSKGLVIGQTSVPDSHVLTLRQASDDKFSGMKIINASNTRYARFFVGSNGTVFDAQNGTFMLRNFNQDRLFMALDGKVGIGNKTPSEQLEVSGKVFSNTGGFMFPDSSVQVSATRWTNSDVDVYLDTGWVTIGSTPSALAPLAVHANNSPPIVSVIDSSTWNSLTFRNNDGSRRASVAMSPHSLFNGYATVLGSYNGAFWSNPLVLENGAPSGTIYGTSMGYVGIGTTTPTTQLEVADTIFASAGGFKFPDNSVQTSAASSWWNESAGDVYYNGGSVVVGDVPSGSNVPLEVVSTTSPPVLIRTDSTKFNTISFQTPGATYRGSIGLSPGSLFGGNAMIIGTYDGGWTDPIILEKGAPTGTFYAASNGDVGFGNTGPLSKVHVTSGDVYIDDPAYGIILVAPNSSCWRITVDNAGVLVSTSITCP